MLASIVWLLALIGIACNSINQLSILFETYYAFACLELGSVLLNSITGLSVVWDWGGETEWKLSYQKLHLSPPTVNTKDTRSTKSMC